MPAYRIADARKMMGWNQKQLAEALGTTQQVISRYESGERDPRTSTLVRIGELTGVSLTFLLGMDDDFEDSVTFPQSMAFDTELSEIASSLNPAGRDVLMAVARSLAANPEFSA